ncbi:MULTISPECIES: hypothetical protein [Hyphobacterium]|uniref:Uncharacterized protein n=1 Tax=Hyphobacterium vulgare TaxID=1736751 RepID=A0ABV6ZUQ3_9PROT
MTDATDSRTLPVPLFSGRLEALRQNFTVALVFLIVTLGMTSATIFGIGPALANWPMNPAFDVAILFVCWLSGLPIMTGLVIAYFGKAERADILTMPQVLRAARRVNTGRSMALIYAFALILALGGYIWIRIEFEGRSVPAMHLIAIAAGVWTGYYMLETLRARGWRWRR